MVLGAHEVSSWALGGVLGEARTRLECPRGVLETQFGDPMGQVHDGEIHNNTNIPMVFQ